MQVEASRLRFCIHIACKYVWFKFLFRSTRFNIQPVTAVPGGCSSLHQENVENQNDLTCSQWQWSVHMQVEASRFWFCAHRFLRIFPSWCWLFGFLKLGDLLLCFADKEKGTRACRLTVIKQAPFPFGPLGTGKVFVFRCAICGAGNLTLRGLSKQHSLQRLAQTHTMSQSIAHLRVHLDGTARDWCSTVGDVVGACPWGQRHGSQMGFSCYDILDCRLCASMGAQAPWPPAAAL